MTLFAIQHIYLPDGINHVSILIHVKEKTVTVLMRIVAMKNIDIKVWTRKS